MGYWRSTTLVYAKGAFICNSNTGCANQRCMSTWHCDSANINPMHTGSLQTPTCIRLLWGHSNCNISITVYLAKPNIITLVLVQWAEVFLHCRSPCMRQGMSCTRTSYMPPKIWALSALCLCWTTLGNTRHGDLGEIHPVWIWPRMPGNKNTHTKRRHHWD